MSTFPRKLDSLLGENVPIDFFSLGVCRCSRASFFYLSSFLRYTIVIRRDKHWPNQILTAFGLRKNRRKDRLIYTDLVYYMTIRHSPLWYFYVIRPFMVLRKNFRLFCKFMKCKGRVGLFRNNVTVNTDFALLHFYCPLYKQFLSSQVFLLIFHALFDFLKWRGKIYWWEKHWTPKRRCKFWRLTNNCSIGTLHYNFYPNPPAFFMAELF